MTKQECAVLMAYTGVVLLQDDDIKYFYQYLDYIFHRPVATHEIPKLVPIIREKSQEDFMRILENAVDMEVTLTDWDYEKLEGINE